MCLYTSSYLHITVVLRFPFILKLNLSVAIVVSGCRHTVYRCILYTNRRGGVSFSLQWFPKRLQKKWLQDIYSCHLCTQFTIPLTEVYRCQMLPPAPLTHTRYTHCTEQVVLHMYAVHQYNYLVQIHCFILFHFTQRTPPPHIVHNIII